MRVRTAMLATALAGSLVACGTGTDPDVSPSPTVTVEVDLSAYESPEEALVAAARSSDEPLAQAALDAGADPNATDPETFNTALIFAARRGDAEMVRLLIDGGASIEDQELGYGPLAFSSSGEVTRILLDAGASVNGFGDFVGGPLMNAVYQHHADVVEVLLQAGADPNVIWEDPTIPGGYTTPLLSATFNYASEIARLLLDYGADPSIAAGDGTTPRDWAEFRSDTELAELLESYGG